MLRTVSIEVLVEQRGPATSVLPSLMAGSKLPKVLAPTHPANLFLNTHGLLVRDEGKGVQNLGVEGVGVMA
jgi:hypothetical protein